MKNSFIYAFRGLLSCAQTERNFRFHLAMAFYVVVGGFITRLSVTEWTAVLICIGGVTGAELFNTAIEKLCDALHPDLSPAIGLVKDITAGAVLMFAAASAVVGGIIFFRADKIELVLSFVRVNPAFSIAVVLTVPAALYLVFRSYNHDKNSRHYHRRTSQRR